eukprot:GHVO01057005.1.p1 GENE.GHVO01057005.1~~GHVO01057005.1.p1  ORF type:complete len:304 (-),score=36.10 GHVO01057005.1:134-1045(-)
MLRDEPTCEVLLRLQPVSNIAGHVTRAHICDNKYSPLIAIENGQRRAVGALIGTIEANIVEIHTSFETKIEEDNNISVSFLKTRLAEFREVMPKYDFIGFYVAHLSSFMKPGNFEMQLIMTVESINENPLIMCVDGGVLLKRPQAAVKGSNDKTGLDVGSLFSFYERIRRSPNDHFKRLPAEMSPTAPEQVAAERINRVHLSESDPMNINGMGTSVHIMSQRVQLIREYLEAVRDGKCAKDTDLLRSISALCASIQKDSSPPAVGMADEIRMQLASSTTPVLLSGVTQLASDVSDIIEMFSAS